MGMDTLTSQQKYQRSPKGRYQAHKRHAKARSIPFEITFDEWWELWEPYWELRGRANTDYVMCRKGDIGPYSKANVYIQTGLHNRVTSVKAVGTSSASYINVDNAAILKLVKEGKAYREIAPLFNVSTRVVARVVQEARDNKLLPPNTRKPPKRISEETKKAIRLERELEGTSWGNLATKYDVDKKSISRILNKETTCFTS